MSAASNRILVPVDGSANALRAVEFAAGLVKGRADARVELVNVQAPVGQAVSMFVARADIKGYQREEGMKALAAAIEALKREGLPHGHHIGVGRPGEVIAHFAAELKCDHIVMGTRGLGSTLGLLLGSVATDVIHRCTVPITLVK
ncbi:MAG: universal stress protein [Alphaproteobacteria bacterium]|nr:universal stress protein [Alphaproteobacteria bacterium]